MTSFSLHAIPSELSFEVAPVDWNLNEEETLSITSGAETDLFTAPDGRVTIDNSARALFVPQEDFLLSAKVKVDFASQFDAGVLILYDTEKAWAKLCFEYSPQQQPMVVSVVNRDFSDDCNSVPVDGNEVYLRVSGKDRAFAFHFSTDGKFWHMVRFFSLGELQNLRIGFSSQSPTGQGCRSEFSEIHYGPNILTDNRNGE
ncbi:MAG: DUF1349 domain-containing protein [bacterium]|nr:DUF1349 domain-containing protein [bacterium]